MLFEKKFLLTMMGALSLLVAINLLCASTPTSQAHAYTRLPVYINMAKACPDLSVRCEIAYLKKITNHLCVNNVITVNPAYWKSRRKQQSMPEYLALTKKPTELPVNQILFMQDTASLPFLDNKHDIIDDANGIKTGAIKPKDLPPILVWLDLQGRVWAINHRRLIAMILAGRTHLTVKWADKTTVLHNKFEFTSTSGGKKITVWITDNIGMIVINDGTCRLDGWLPRTRRGR